MTIPKAEQGRKRVKLGQSPKPCMKCGKKFKLLFEGQRICRLCSEQNANPNARNVTSYKPRARSKSKVIPQDTN
jgi:hypothetical protein